MNDETARRKMIFLALLSGAWAYRKEYIDQDIETNRITCEELGTEMINDPTKKINTPDKRKKMEKMAKGMHYRFRKAAERFNEVCAKEIELVTNEFKIPTDGSFQSYVNGFGAVISEYLNAKDTGDLIAVCQAYNAGLLDEVLTIIKEQQVEEKKDFLEKVEGIEKASENTHENYNGQPETPFG